MKKGDIILASIPLSNGGYKERPALLINIFPPYDDSYLWYFFKIKPIYTSGSFFDIKRRKIFYRDWTTNNLNNKNKLSSGFAVRGHCRENRISYARYL